ncbi:MAG TPA: OmpA family protein [Puia sp.]|jgi:outer membrane protein OmpA-like peptidoglycan-associated protein|nr:OmpA family protein [Puia sp.]
MSFYFSYSQQIKDTSLIVYFDNNKYSLSADETGKLDSFFLNHQSATIKNISGFTDSVGSSVSNFILAEKRNRSAIALLKKYSFLNKNYPVNNFGETHPASQTDNTLNRRVEIVIQFKKDLGDATKIKPESAVIKKIVLDKLYFKPDLPVLESFSLDYLKRTAEILKTYTDAKFEIRGHVNCPLNVPANSDYMKSMNQLSEDRAKTVFEILKDNGIPAEKMTYKGMGNTEMINPYATTDEEKRQNMRVEIFILNN